MQVNVLLTENADRIALFKLRLKCFLYFMFVLSKKGSSIFAFRGGRNSSRAR